MNNTSKTKLAVGAVGSLAVIYFFPTFFWWGLLFGGGYFVKTLQGPTKLDKLMESGDDYKGLGS